MTKDESESPSEPAKAIGSLPEKERQAIGAMLDMLKSRHNDAATWKGNPPLPLLVRNYQDKHEGRMTMTDREILELLLNKMGNLEINQAAIQETLEQANTRLDGVDSRLDSVDSRLDSIDSRLDGIDSRLDGVDSRLDSIDSNVKYIWEDIKRLDKRLTAQDEELVLMKRLK